VIRSLLLLAAALVVAGEAAAQKDVAEGRSRDSWIRKK
jgi:hypothetical protein